MSSYQKGSTGPRTIEEIGVSAPELHRKKAIRRFLFATLGVIFLLAFVAMALVVHQHQRQFHEGYLSTTSSDDGTLDLIEPTISVDMLNRETNTSIASGCETTILLFRHCEKEGEETFDEDGNEHCSYVGYERAQFIPSLFVIPGQEEKAGGKWPVPTALFALTERRSNNHNFREMETLLPLANRYGLKIQSDVEHNNGLVKKIFKGLASGHWCGKTVLVSWKHEYLASLAEQLGCSDCPDAYPDPSFDEVWQLKYVYDVLGTYIIQSSHMKPKATTTTTKGGQRERRELKSALKPNKSIESTTTTTTTPQKKWSIYSTITAQNFDPLKFSLASGDYNGDSSSSSAGGKWFRPEYAGTPDEGEM